LCRMEMEYGSSGGGFGCGLGAVGGTADGQQEQGQGQQQHERAQANGPAHQESSSVLRPSSLILHAPNYAQFRFAVKLEVGCWTGAVLLPPAVIKGRHRPITTARQQTRGGEAPSQQKKGDESWGRTLAVAPGAGLAPAPTHPAAWPARGRCDSPRRRCPAANCTRAPTPTPPHTSPAPPRTGLGARGSSQAVQDR